MNCLASMLSVVYNLRCGLLAHEALQRADEHESLLVMPEAFPVGLSLSLWRSWLLQGVL